MSRKIILYLLLISIFPCFVFAHEFSLYFTGSYVWSYDTNVFSNPMVQYDEDYWWANRERDPYIKRFNHGFSLNTNMFFSEKARTGLSLDAHIGFPYKSTSYKPNGVPGGDWEYFSWDSLGEQKVSMFFSIGPVFRVILGPVDISLAIRGSLGSYDYFDNNIILGIQAEPFINVFIVSDMYLTAGLYYNAQFMYFYFNSVDDQLYMPNFLRLSVGAFVGFGFKFGGNRSTNV